MANTIVYGQLLKGGTVNDEVGAKVTFDSDGIAEMDITDTSLLKAVQYAGAAIVDKTGSEEALTAGTVQTATTLSALVFRNGAAATVLNVRLLDGTGALVIGPISIAANVERVIVFPDQITGITGGVFIDVDSGGLNATPGFLIP